MIICMEGGSWRSDYYPLYKWRRKQARAQAAEAAAAGEGIDWAKVFETVDEVCTALQEVFPFKVMRVRGAEADDIIAVLARKFAQQAETQTDEEDVFFGGGTRSKRTLILSSDKDFKQLQILGNVDQYSPILKKDIVCEDPQAFWKELILRGDSGDDVPNMLSADESFRDKIKQKQITKPILEAWLEAPTAEEFFRRVESGEILKGLRDRVPVHQMRANYARNLKMVDLHTQIPAEIVEKIEDEFKKPAGGSLSETMRYMQSKRLRNLLGLVNDFRVHK